MREDEPVLEDRQRESSRRILGAAVANLAFGFVLVIGALVAATALHVETSTAFTLVGLTAYTVFLTASNCLEAYLRSERRLTLVVAATLLEKSLLLVLVSAALLLGTALWLIALAYVLAGFVRLWFVSLTIFVKQRVPLLVPTYRHVRGFVLSGVPFAFNTVALNVIPRLDPLIVALLSATAAGYFAVGDRLVTAALIVPTVAGTALYPFLARETATSRVAWKISAGMLLVGFAAAVAGALLAPAVVPLVFGAQYERGVPAIQLMLFVIPFVYASNPLLVQLYTSGKERKLLGPTLLVALVGTAAIVVGQISFGVVGAAAGYVLRAALFMLALSVMARVRRAPPVGVEAVGTQEVG